MAWNKKITVEADIIRGQRVSRTQQRQSFETLAEFWYRNHVHRHLTQKVAQWYRYKLDRQLLPFWAKIQVGNIDADTVSQWAEWCEKEGWSPWTILEAFTAFSAALG